MRSVHLFAVEVCRFLEEEQVEYALLGDACVSSVPAAHRLEIVVTSEVLHELPLLFHKFCQRSEAKLVMCAREHRQGWRYVLSWLNRGDRPEFVTVEAFCDFVRHGRRLLTGEELLSARSAEVPLLRLRAACFVAAPAMEFIYCLLRCVHENLLSEEQAQHLGDCWQRDPEGAAAQVVRFWDRSRDGGTIEHLAEQADWLGLRALLPALAVALRRRQRVRPADWLHGIYRRVREWLRPAGLLLACLGPEGVGKASVIGALKDRPLAPFRQVHTMELRPRVLLARPAPAVQAQERPRGDLATIAKLMMFAVDYWVGYWVQIRPRLVRTMLVLSNRYYNDVFVDPRRYRMARPAAFARALLPWIPRPDLWLVLDAPSEVISARNAAASAEESSRQRREYRRLLRGYENVVVLDARQPLDKLVAQAERTIVAYLEDRTSRALGLPRTSPTNPFSTKLLLFFCRRNVPVLSRFVRILYNSDICCRLPAQLYMPHPYGIVIHAQAVVGDRVTVMQQVAIGDKEEGETVAPVIGNDVYIGAGARVLGDVHIGDGVTIGANAVVTQDIPPGVTVVGANRIVSAPAGAVSPSVRPVTALPVGVQRGA